MLKQLLILIIAASLFVTVWVFVIIQFTGTEHDADLSLSNVERVDHALDLPETVHEEGSTEIDGYNGEDFDEIKKVETDIEHQEGLFVEERMEQTDRFLNLADYDFSDFSTSEGVPIEAILSKLDLN